MELLIDIFQASLIMVGIPMLLMLPILYLIYPFLIGKEVKRLHTELDIVRNESRCLLEESRYQIEHITYQLNESEQRHHSLQHQYLDLNDQHSQLRQQFDHHQAH